MKKATARPKKRPTNSQSVDRDEILPEYDFSGGTPNPYAQRYAASGNLVRLDPDHLTGNLENPRLRFPRSHNRRFHHDIE